MPVCLFLPNYATWHNFYTHISGSIEIMDSPYAAEQPLGIGEGWNVVIPANAGIQEAVSIWIPPCAGMTGAETPYMGRWPYD
jgi:hypothetical protein